MTKCSKGVQSRESVVMGGFLLIYLCILEDKAVIEYVQISHILCLQTYSAKVQIHMEPTLKGRKIVLPFSSKTDFQ